MMEHYQTLGIAPGASKEEIRQAFRRCAMLHHPDRNGSSPESQEKFKKCKAAYDALTSTGGSQHTASSFNDLQDIFNTIFGRTTQRQGYPSGKGQDVLIPIRISLLDAVRGRTVDIDVPSWQVCPSCTQSPANRQPCRRCQGRGFTSASIGLMTMRNDCPECHGRGKAPLSCGRCDNGIVHSSRKIKVSLPAGIREGMRLRVPGAGRPGLTPDDNHGDLFVQVHIGEDAHFQRVDQDLHCQIQVVATVATVGGRAPLEWIDGTMREVIIPPGTTHGTRIRIPGAGLPGFSGSSPGDLLCHVVLSMPADLSTKQRRLLEKFNATLD